VVVCVLLREIVLPTRPFLTPFQIVVSFHAGHSVLAILFLESFMTKAIFPAFSNCCNLRQCQVDFLVYSTLAFLTRVLGLSRCAKRFISIFIHRHLLMLPRRSAPSFRHPERTA